MAKRIRILAGHYGSGKTNVALNLAYRMKREGRCVAIADLDIVNPYFRTKDSAQDLREADIRLISSPYANTNLDIPALPQEMYAIVDDRNTSFVVDVGGDDRGALALGRLTPSILAENDYEMLLVVNFFRPLTKDVASLISIVEEMERASGIRFTGMINNSNLGCETSAEDVLSTVKKMEEASCATGLPVVYTTVMEELSDSLCGKIENLLPIVLQKKYY